MPLREIVAQLKHVVLLDTVPSALIFFTHYLAMRTKVRPS
jgi:hypothetical protein